MSLILRGAPRANSFPEDTPLKSCKRCGTATGGVIDGQCASSEGRIADSIAALVVDPPPICEIIAAFADGEFDAIAAQAFREHLAGCSTCERQLLTQLQLGAAISLLTPR